MTRHYVSRTKNIQLFRERLSEKNVHATIPKGNMGYDQYTVPDTVHLLLLLSFSTRRHMSMASRAILSNFFEKQWTKNHPQYLSGLSRALFPTTFLETAVYAKANGIHICPEHFTDNIERRYFRSALKRWLYSKMIYSKDIIVLGGSGGRHFLIRG